MKQAFDRCSPEFEEDWTTCRDNGKGGKRFTPKDTDFFTLYRFYVIQVVDKIPSNCCTVLDTCLVSFIHVKGKFDV
ncbi:hypothetical protein BSR03_13605 [Serratia proteamaculans]|nr:hypothetical protein E4343_10355 [Serratia quinivorans]RYM60970.1 hypothetical protein BSR03_13605 [Serratia proteamaculans]